MLILELSLPVTAYCFDLKVILDRILPLDDDQTLVQQQKGGDRMSKPLVRLFAATAVKGGLNNLASITPVT